MKNLLSMSLITLTLLCSTACQPSNRTPARERGMTHKVDCVTGYLKTRGLAKDVYVGKSGTNFTMEDGKKYYFSPGTPCRAVEL